MKLEWEFVGVEASVTVLMGYYNTRLALWEPLIEPVEKKVGDSLTFEPWELKLELSMNEPDEGLNFTSPTSERGDEVSFSVYISFFCLFCLSRWKYQPTNHRL